MTKTLLIGWDAADWKVISPLIDAGEMPNLARLIDAGVMGNLATLYPVLSPMLWTSIATGKRAYKHGIHGFSEPDPVSGGVRPISILGRKTKAVWNILNQQGLRPHVIGWWPSWPAEPIDGVMVSNHFQEARGPLGRPWPLAPAHVHPPRLRETLMEFRVHPEELDPEMLLLFVPGAAAIDQTQDKRLNTVAKVLAECASIQGAATYVMQTEPWDFMAVYFDAIDHFCHGFMKYHPPRLSWVNEADFDLYRDVVNAGYRLHDLMLGVLLDLAGPDTNVLICSDHGFHPDHLRVREIPNEPAGPADEHRHFGIFAARGPAFQRDTLVFGATLLDLTPTILHLHGLPVGADMDGRPLYQALQDPTPAAVIPSWDQVPGADGRHPDDLRIDPLDAREALQQLVDLGYIEAPGADRQEATVNTIKELRYNLARDLADAGRLCEALAIHAELWEAHPDESRFGVHLFNLQLDLKDTAAAGATLALIESRKRDYAAKARAEMDQVTAERKARRARPPDPAADTGADTGPAAAAIPEPVPGPAPESPAPPDERPDEKEQRRLRRLRKRAGTNRAALAWMRGRLLAAEGRHGEALVEFREAERVQVHNRPSLLLAQAQALLGLRRFAEAEQRLRLAMHLDPVNGELGYNLARTLLMQRGRTAEALATAEAALGVLYFNPQAHYLRAVALMRLARLEEAEAALATTLAQNPVFPAAQLRMARLCRRRGDEAGAEAHLGLARAARVRLREVGAGEPPPPANLADLTPIATESLASLRDLGTPRALPPLADDEVVIVSGLPRSGTSMLMQMLAAGGLPILTDGERAPDTDNPRGYLEFEAAKRPGGDTGWLAQARGQAVKIVAQLLPALTATHRYRIIFMERPLNEVIASQRVMLARLGKPGARAGDRSAERRLAQTFLRQVAQVRRRLEPLSERVAVLSLPYHQALADPAGAAATVNAFLGGRLDETAMARAVEPGLRRQGAGGAPERAATADRGMPPG